MNPNCPYCKPSPTVSARRSVVRKGFFRRKCDGGKLTRYWCYACRRSFSTATFDSCYRQKKRHLNPILFRLLAKGNTQRGCAFILKINRKTVERKFIFLGKTAAQWLNSWNESLPKASLVQFDDLETFEHSKLKPLSVTLAVEARTRQFLAFQVSAMPAKGRTATSSVKKYGKRVDQRKSGRRRMLEQLSKIVNPSALIQTDENPHYVQDIKRYFPDARHIGHKGQRGSTTGQGELKKIRFDPLFSLNHTCAKMRAEISRLIRKTWTTTKKKERLAYHIGIFALYHNQNLKKLWL